MLINTNITNEELVVSGFLSGTALNCGLYKATMETSIELNKCYGPFKSLTDFLSVLPSINNNREENHKILLPSYNFTDRYKLVIDTFTLKNTSTFTRTSIIKFINEKVKILQEGKHKNTLLNFFNVKYVLEYIQSITTDSYLIQKYRGKIRDYSKIHFGITIILYNDEQEQAQEQEQEQEQDLENSEHKYNINNIECVC